MTHRDYDQIVSPAALRKVLRAAGEDCYCAVPGHNPNTDWDPGYCPAHRAWCRDQDIGDYWHPASGVPHPEDR